MNFSTLVWLVAALGTSSAYFGPDYVDCYGVYAALYPMSVDFNSYGYESQCIQEELWQQPVGFEGNQCYDACYNQIYGMQVYQPQAVVVLNGYFYADMTRTYTFQIDSSCGASVQMGIGWCPTGYDYMVSQNIYTYAGGYNEIQYSLKAGYYYPINIVTYTYGSSSRFSMYCNGRDISERIVQLKPDSYDVPCLPGQPCVGTVSEAKSRKERSASNQNITFNETHERPNSPEAATVEIQHPQTPMPPAETLTGSCSGSNCSTWCSGCNSTSNPDQAQVPKSSNKPEPQTPLVVTETPKSPEAPHTSVHTPRAHRTVETPQLAEVHNSLKRPETPKSSEKPVAPEKPRVLKKPELSNTPEPPKTAEVSVNPESPKNSDVFQTSSPPEVSETSQSLRTSSVPKIYKGQKFSDNPAETSRPENEQKSEKSGTSSTQMRSEKPRDAEVSQKPQATKGPDEGNSKSTKTLESKKKHDEPHTIEILREVKTSKKCEYPKTFENSTASEPSSHLGDLDTFETSLALQSPKQSEGSKAFENSKTSEDSKTFKNSTVSQSPKQSEGSKIFANSKTSEGLKTFATSKTSITSKEPESPETSMSSKEPESSKQSESSKTSKDLRESQSPKTSEDLKTVETSKVSEPPKQSEGSRTSETAKAPDSSKTLETAKAPDSSKTFQTAKAPKSSKTLETEKAPGSSKVSEAPQKSVAVTHKSPAPSSTTSFSSNIIEFNGAESRAVELLAVMPGLLCWLL